MRQMRNQMLQTMGQQEEDNAPIQPVGLQFYRQILGPRVSPVMGREALNVSAALDALVGCHARLSSGYTGAEAEEFGEHQRRCYMASGSEVRGRASRPSDGKVLGTARETREEFRTKQLQRGQWAQCRLEGKQGRLQGQERRKRERQDQRQGRKKQRRRRSEPRRQDREASEERILEEEEI